MAKNVESRLSYFWRVVIESSVTGLAIGIVFSGMGVIGGVIDIKTGLIIGFAIFIAVPLLAVFAQALKRAWPDVYPQEENTGKSPEGEGKQNV